MSDRLEIMEIPCRSWRLGNGSRQVTLVWSPALVIALRSGQIVASYPLPREAETVFRAATTILAAIRAKCSKETDLGEVDRLLRTWALRIAAPQNGRSQP